MTPKAHEPVGLYDDPSSFDDDAWFMPAPVESDDLPPLPRADQRHLFNPAEWRGAQADLALELADLALRFGALDDRLRGQAIDSHRRLALLEVADLGWWTGDRIPADRLAQWHELRLAGVQEDAQALARADWAVRRLSGGPAPAQGGWAIGLSAFLGRGQADGASRGDIADMAQVMDDCLGLHRITEAAVLFHLWRKLGQGGPVRETEAAVLAARHAATAGRGGALFLPVALASGAGLRAGGSVRDVLAAWLRGAELAVQAALLHLDRLRDWQRKASNQLDDLQGRVPALLVQLFSDLPTVSAPLAEARSGASRAAVQRNLNAMPMRGLIRETTGQSRYRTWTAAL